jgi:chemotaxis protein MotB
MRAALIIMIILFLAVIGTGFYYFYFEVMPLKTELTTLRQQNAELQQQFSALSKEKEAKEEQIETVAQTYQNLIEDMQEEIKRGEIKISELAGKLKVNIVDKILFDSGESSVNEQGKKILARVGNILKQDTTKIIRVEGHTDNVQIHRRLKKQFPTNWELSTSRATHVVRFLQDKLRVDGRFLEAVGYSEYRPVASNANITGRASNRRIEITMIPR